MNEITRGLGNRLDPKVRGLGWVISGLPSSTSIISWRLVIILLIIIVVDNDVFLIFILFKRIL